MHTGERQAAKMRMAYLRSMLNQDITLFDTEASTGEVISAITSDITIVQEALSEKVINWKLFIYFLYLRKVLLPNSLAPHPNFPFHN